MKFFLIFFLILNVINLSVGQDKNHELSIRDTTDYMYWESLSSLCGKSFLGTIVAGPPNDTAFEGKQLVMHVKKCSENQIKIPFFVGNNRSRTWVLTKTATGIELKHDHRHQDGSPDKITMYGGHSSNNGNKTRQLFPADQETANIIPAAIGNIWWIDINNDSFIYNLRRVNTDRLFSVRFDITKPIENPGSPWGWKD